MERPDFFELQNGTKVKLPFSKQEYKKQQYSYRFLRYPATSKTFRRQ